MKKQSLDSKTAQLHDVSETMQYLYTPEWVVALLNAPPDVLWASMHDILHYWVRELGSIVDIEYRDDNEQEIDSILLCTGMWAENKELLAVLKTSNPVFWDQHVTYYRKSGKTNHITVRLVRDKNGQ